MTRRVAQATACTVFGVTAGLLGWTTVVQLGAAGTGWAVANRLLSTAAVLTCAVVGTVVVAHRPRNVIGWMLGGVGLMASVSSLARSHSLVLGHGRATLTGTRDAIEWTTWLGGVTWVIAGWLLVAVVLLFPDGRLPSRRWRWILWATALLFAGALTRFALTPGPMGETSGFRNPAPFEPARALAYRIAVFERSADIWWLAFVVMLVLAAAAPLIRMTRSAGELRQQLKWFAFAGSALALIQTLATLRFFGGVDGVWVGRLMSLGSAGAFALFFMAIGVAILKYRLWDIDIVIRRTILLSCLLVVVGAGYGAATTGVGSIVGDRAADGPLASFSATALIAAFVQPVRRRSERLADRVVFGRRATPYAVLAGFTEQVSTVVALEEALDVMAEAIGIGTAAHSACVRIFLPGGAKTESEWRPEPARKPGAARVVLPVEHGCEAIGEIEVVKPAGDTVRPIERELLLSIAAQAGAVLSRVRLAAELQDRVRELDAMGQQLAASRRRLVTAHLEARRRFEEDVRARVSPHLDAVATALRDASDDLAANRRESATRRLHQAVDDAGVALEEVRRLARGISDPVLRDRGLAAALDSLRARRAIHLVTDVPAVSGEEASSTVHACVIETAIGGTATVSVRRRNGSVELEVIPGAPLSSSTLEAVADRVEAVGGAAILDPGRVLVRLPDGVSTPAISGVDPPS